MSTLFPVPPYGLVFPDSDGQPMAENTRQWEAIATLRENIEAFAPTDAFVASDHLVYVNPKDPTERQAPDVYVAFGRPRGHRGSYKVWEEGNVFPQVVFEVLGPSNTQSEMRAKRRFYFHHGAEEYYEFDPEAGLWLGFVLDQSTGLPRQIANMDGHISPLLGMRFQFQPLELKVFRPDGTRFLSFLELEDEMTAERQRAEHARQQVEQERQRAEQERQRAEHSRQQAEQERQRAEQERQRAEHAQQQAEQERQRAASGALENDRLRSLLRAAGIDPDTLPGPPS